MTPKIHIQVSFINKSLSTTCVQNINIKLYSYSKIALRFYLSRKFIIDYDQKIKIILNISSDIVILLIINIAMKAYSIL